MLRNGKKRLSRFFYKVWRGITCVRHRSFWPCVKKLNRRASIRNREQERWYSRGIGFTLTLTTQKTHRTSDTMSPNKEDLGVFEEKGFVVDDASQKKVSNLFKMDESEVDYGQPIKWFNIFALSSVHILAIYGLIVGITHIKLVTVLFNLGYGFLCIFGITSGVHRLWAHRSYKANVPLRVILMLCYACAGQNKIYTWVRDHRVHHKFSETPADPHNSKRGLFFSHMGWLMKKKHPLCLQQGKKIDMSDIENDEIVQFYDDNFEMMKGMFCFVIPTLIIRKYLGEPWWIAILSNLVRYIISLNGTWVVNSLAHVIGNHPYDVNIGPTDNVFAASLSFGEGWHNYHHTFPYDYRTSEFGLHKFNVPTMFIDFFAWIGWAYDRKSVSVDMALRQAKKKGDGSRFADQKAH
ncbi:acyl-CoA Delta(11) desaturase-like [Neocloeon triangulifer]|uniref:acyl-CoA Delta(11) desaturase-like n=1 Tax=Neocloeon triangulifer TaxID=2078957 RepID=UPI00286F0FEA|nr:acyl-CoA Delta(11) desaturase-like [Neocloeon triangulifer]